MMMFNPNMTIIGPESVHGNDIIVIFIEMIYSNYTFKEV